MTTRITGMAIALLLTAGACKRRDEATAPAVPTTVPTVAPPAAPDVPMQPVAVVDAGAPVPGPNAMAQPGTIPAPGTLAPGAAPPTGLPPAAPIAAAPPAPAAPATAPTAPTAARPTAPANRPTEIRIPGVTNQPPINIEQQNGQTRVNVGGVQIVIPGVN